MESGRGNAEDKEREREWEGGEDRQQRGEGVMWQPSGANGCHRKASGGIEVLSPMERDSEGGRKQSERETSTLSGYIQNQITLYSGTYIHQ